MTKRKKGFWPEVIERAVHALGGEADLTEINTWIASNVELTAREKAPGKHQRRRNFVHTVRNTAKRMSGAGDLLEVGRGRYRAMSFVFTSHLDEAGKPRMVDVSGKEATAREATAKGSVFMSAETLRLATAGGAAKGDVLTTAQIAGIMAAKRTHELVPLCHPLPLSGIDVSLEPDESSGAVQITATVRTTARTGVEMEALTAVSVAALTVYDMLKAAQKDMRIGDIRLARKTGGKSGDYEETGEGK